MKAARGRQRKREGEEGKEREIDREREIKRKLVSFAFAARI